MVFTCELKLSDEELTNDGDDVDYTIQWFDVDHNNREITDRTGRLIWFSAYILDTDLLLGLIDIFKSYGNTVTSFFVITSPEMKKNDKE